MDCQPAYLVRIPPAISPVVPAAAPRPPQIPSALLRSAPSSNMFITIERAAGSMIAPPSPCTARLAISRASVVASAHASEAAVNRARPSIRIRRRPRRSAARPPNSRNPPNVSAYAVTTHCSPVALRCRSRPIVGSETLTIVKSTIVMKYAAASSENAPHRLKFRDVDVIRTSLWFAALLVETPAPAGTERCVDRVRMVPWHLRARPHAASQGRRGAICLHTRSRF